MNHKIYLVNTSERIANDSCIFVEIRHKLLSYIVENTYLFSNYIANIIFRIPCNSAYSIEPQENRNKMFANLDVICIVCRPKIPFTLFGNASHHLDNKITLSRMFWKVKRK